MKLDEDSRSSSCPRVALHGQQAWWSLQAGKEPDGMGGRGRVNQEERVHGKEQANGCLDRLLVFVACCVKPF